MFDFGAFQTLRHLLGRGAPAPGDVDARLHLSRHDHHSLELKSAFELDRQGMRAAIDFYLFVPRSVHLDACTQAELRSDMHARVRLSVPREVDSDLARLDADIAKLRCLLSSWDDPRNDHLRADVAEEVFQTARHVGALVGEVLKQRALHHQREVLLAHSLASAPSHPSANLVAVAAGAEEMGRLVTGLREVVRVRCAAELPVLLLLDQYLHPLYVEYLGTVRAELDHILQHAARFTRQRDRYEEGWQTLRTTLNGLQAREAREAQAHGWGTADERHLVQQGQLKKFFQSDMFVEVSQRETLRRISEPLAAFGAAFAGFVALALERSLNPSWFSLGFQSVFAVCVGVALYVLRDRLKDAGRAYLARKIGRLLPDLESEMVAEGRAIGSTDEWLHVKTRDKVPPDVVEARLQARITEAERHIPEDVLHYRKVFELAPTGRTERLALQEVVRINLERHLRHMDDPFKTVRRLDSDGSVSSLEQRRVYYFHACLTATFQPLSAERDANAPPTWGPHVYRVVLDKNGIVRVDELGDDGALLMPERLGGETPVVGLEESTLELASRIGR